MRKLMLSVAVVMMSMNVLTYAQDAKVEPAPADSVPTQDPKKEEPKSELFGICMSEEPASTDSVPSQDPQKEEPQASFVCMSEEPAPTDSVPTQDPQKDKSQESASIA